MPVGRQYETLFWRWHPAYSTFRLLYRLWIRSSQHCLRSTGRMLSHPVLIAKYSPWWREFITTRLILVWYLRRQCPLLCLVGSARSWLWNRLLSWACSSTPPSCTIGVFSILLLVDFMHASNSPPYFQKWGRLRLLSIDKPSIDQSLCRPVAPLPGLD